jgi:hypothetical protein
VRSKVDLGDWQPAAQIPAAKIANIAGALRIHFPVLFPNRRLGAECA